MSKFSIKLPLGPSAPIGEILLAETAVRIELPPSLHRLAVERYEALRKYIERDASPLVGQVRIFYPQGSMAIRATIRSRKREDGFDIDIVAELTLPPTTTPAAVLDLLFAAINAEAGSLYHGKVERNTRCVTVRYEDDMHLDITPSVLIDERDPRRSVIFHAKAGQPPATHRRLEMNSYAFVEWFNLRTPIDLSFVEAYAKRAFAFDHRADAEVKPVPAHSSTDGGKSATVVAMQLLKRNRNLKYARRAGRMPPSVMIATISGECAVPGNSISGALAAITDCMIAALSKAQAEGRLIDVRNPECPNDCFTDRWPENLTAQSTYIDDLKLFRQQLAALMSDELSLQEKSKLLGLMFGEGPARAVVEDYAARIGESVRQGTRRIASSGRVLPAAVAAPAIITPAAAQPRGHTFYGSRWPHK
jgi:Second Messenger Oligonucleotide or Dinucleotide Synthetase domain